MVRLGAAGTRLHPGVPSTVVVETDPRSIRARRERIRGPLSRAALNLGAQRDQGLFGAREAQVERHLEKLRAQCDRRA
jgi:hypothetical protein